ncbi:MAG: hypothetical protein ABFD89_02350, partial [Bryobacteraceae bacterium]
MRTTSLKALLSFTKAIKGIQYGGGSVVIQWLHCGQIAEKCSGAKSAGARLRGKRAKNVDLLRELKIFESSRRRIWQKKSRELPGA